MTVSPNQSRNTAQPLKTIGSGSTAPRILAGTRLLPDERSEFSMGTPASDRVG